MKVGITAGVYYPEIGGGGTYLKLLRDDLLAAGHEVQVVAFGETGPSAGVVRVSRGSPIPIRLLRFTYAAWRALQHADVWYANDYGVAAAFLAPLHRKPMVMKVIGDWAWESGVNQGLVPPPGAADGASRGDPLIDLERQRQHPRVELRKAIRRRTARSMDRVLVPSAYLAGVVAGWGVARERIVTIHNGINPVEPSDSPDERELGLIVTAARLVAWKGIDHLIRALPIVRREVPARLIVLGDGPARNDLERLTRELALDGAVSFAGLVDRAAVRKHLSRASVFALPSAYEGLPHVILEAMAEGCPVVAAGAGGTPEVVNDAIDGLLVPFGDPPALAQALVRILQDRALATRFAARGRRRVAEEFNWSATSAATIDLLARLVRGEASSVTK